ncbi:hypothetical protein M8C13_24380 [Crossiella sp. SN42]|uniref:hypothetical protein n=1 Tax=Crossiella sp. SN42 TaxID=2944808 RepID=UPI00207CC144|nr:hypothetical protein [Crossiella sp. SN42]MCO1578896.1 hypothetical protein [Crossiella sp. SN42]
MPSVKDRRDLWAAAALVLLVLAAVIAGIILRANDVPLFAGAAPLFGNWLPHLGPGTAPSVLVAVAVVCWGPRLADRLPWRGSLATGYVIAVLWTGSLATVDGWWRGLAGRLTTTDEYLHEVGGVTDIGAMIAGFAGRILDFQPDSWTTHVSGHPPGVLLVYVLLDRIGLGGGGWAGVVTILLGCLVAVAVPVTVCALSDQDTARRILPFVVLLPGFVWFGVSADGLFAGVTAVGIALLALGGVWRSVLGGLLLGFGLFLSYGLVLLGPLALVVLIIGRGRLLPAAGGVLAVAGVFALAGFWWLDGYHLVVERYYQGIATARPYAYWVWANLAALALATGPALAAGLRRTFAERPRAITVLVGAALLAVLAADLSGLSKAEVERIWLPFAVWLSAGTALLPRPSRRWWLLAQAVTALAVNHLVLTNW